MVTLLMSVGAGGVIVGLLVGAVGLIMVRLATPRPIRAGSMHRRLMAVEEILHDPPRRREAA